ncbi:MAG: hypothetical protein IKF09_00430, partial [Clostridiales bacterium]|nr:hypothetical protein [Clostridiales bacterium]
MKTEYTFTRYLPSFSKWISAELPGHATTVHLHPSDTGETETRGGTPYVAMMRRRDDDTSAEGRLGENRGGVTAHGAGIHLPSGNFPEAR